MSIKIENIEVFGWRGALRGARMPFMSHKKADSYWTYVEDEETLETAEYEFFMGENDHGLAMKLSKGGPVHGKFMRMALILMLLDIAKKDKSKYKIDDSKIVYNKFRINKRSTIF